MRKVTQTGRRIKKKLIDKGMTQAEFSREYGIPQNRLCDIIHSEEYPRIRRRVCEILGISA